MFNWLFDPRSRGDIRTLEEYRADMKMADKLRTAAMYLESGKFTHDPGYSPWEAQDIEGNHVYIACDMWRLSYLKEQQAKNA